MSKDFPIQCNDFILSDLMKAFGPVSEFFLENSRIESRNDTTKGIRT